MKKQEGKKKTYIVLIILFVLLLCVSTIIAIFIWKNIIVKDDNEAIGVQSNIEIVKEIFPNLEGVESVSFEVNNPSVNSRVPGPTELQLRGHIVITEETANKYMSDYEWKEVNVDFSAEYFDVSEYIDDKWYYSADFNNTVISDKFMGAIYFNGKNMWFEVTQF